MPDDRADPDERADPDDTAGRASGAGRYAPSPSSDLHLGNLRTALLAWLFARTTGRALLLRIDDLDAGRSRPEAERRQRADLAALGLTFDPPLLHQSRRADRYAAALDRLVRAGHTFPCFCTRREIAEAASAPHGSPGLYPGTCRDLTPAERAERRAALPPGREPALRLRADRVTATVTDLLRGELTGVVDDLVLRRNDGGHAYHLATVVDDVETGVDQVVRGDDLLDSAFGQAHLTRLLGATAPTYAHVPLAVNADGRRLAKRDGAVTVADLAEQGVTADRVLSRLAGSLGLAAEDEPVDLAVLSDRFDPARLPRTPWVVR
ncbi:glutamyl-tRNA synthetase [Friedmanniella endophytica]|uniref:Glutamyl-Q tRNA(Asp) synthetase n=1 Tax=Microlunatus kandeliicorticis TaxID=1759536 RepID=A0A7W3P6R7_9ACTN|nr:tRNA glutamyl-Q(34) synthetase GluQRS [Microlunatus kandeliicorticis]MBA8795253.1 glutamyl-tRNA synthetase [Microlunatus kandeliicorticis]